MSNMPKVVNVPKICQYLENEFNFQCVKNYITEVDLYLEGSFKRFTRWSFRLTPEYIQKLNTPSMCLYVDIANDQTGFTFEAAAGFSIRGFGYYFKLDQNGDFDHNEINQFFSDNLQMDLVIPAFDIIKKVNT